MVQDDLKSSTTQATSLIFKLSCKISQDGFLEQLHQLCGISKYQYNFVHFPWKQLAIVNFTSAEICARCFQVLNLAAGVPGVCVADVRAGIHQGLEENLAHFCAKCCQQSEYQTLPCIFVNGEEVPLALACKAFVSDALLVQHLEHLPARRKKTGKKAKSNQPRMGQMLHGNQGAPKPESYLNQLKLDIPPGLNAQCYSVEDIPPGLNARCCSVDGVSTIVFSI
eukprot:Skav208304  [mRNA]  locus=scaffold897:283798:284469:+ [translate_table: standard]